MKRIVSLSIVFVFISLNLYAGDLKVSGNLGIGIGATSPGAKLEVVKDADSQWKFGEHPNYAAYSALWSGDEDYTLLKDSSNVFLNARGTGNIYFRQKNNDLMTILNNGNVGIGTTNPHGKLHVNGGNLNLGGTADPAGDQGNNWLTWGYRADNNPYYAIRTQYKTYTPTNGVTNTYSRLQLNWHTGIEIGANSYYGGVRFFNEAPGMGGSQLMSVGDGDSNVRISGNVGIGASNPQSKLSVGGDGISGTGIFGRGVSVGVKGEGYYGLMGWGDAAGYGVWGYGGYGVYCSSNYAYGCGGNRSWYYSSDEGLKENVATLDEALPKIKRLRGVKYNWKADSEKKKQVGMIAQEVMEVIPEAVGLDPDGNLTMSDGPLVALLTEAVKEQQKQIEGQQMQIEALMAEVEKLKKKQ